MEQQIRKLPIIYNNSNRILFILLYGETRRDAVRMRISLKGIAMCVRYVLFLLNVYPLCCEETIAVLILARGGSKGIPLKNLQTVGGLSLLGRAVSTAKGVGLDDITVSTDHPLIALESIKYGAAVWRRSRLTSTDQAPSIWGVLEFIYNRTDITVLVLLQATSPFIQVSHLRKALQKLEYPIPFDCIFSVTRSFKLRWQDQKYRIRSLNFNPQHRPRRQDWNGELLETGAFYITRRNIIEQGILQNNNSTDVTFEDLEATDVISVDLVPERKGLILKHCEYYVSSRRHGTTVTRRYNEFVQLHDILFAKYPYRAVCRLPPKRMVVGGGSAVFLQRRRAALQRWLTLVATHPVLAHDADLRVFLCETAPRLDKPKHDEFVLAGTQEDNLLDVTTDELQAAFDAEQEQLRLVQLGLGRLFKIFERVEGRCEAERADVRELGAALLALSAPAGAALRAAALLASEAGEAGEAEAGAEAACAEEARAQLCLGTEALGAYRELCGRLSRGLHAERAAAASAHRSPAAARLRARHRYALRAAAQEAKVARAYALSALGALPGIFHALGDTHARLSSLWTDLYAALRHPTTKPAIK